MTNKSIFYLSLGFLGISGPSLENVTLPRQKVLNMGYFDAFLIFTVVAVILAFLVLLMKRSVAEKGAHLAAE